MQLSLLIYLLIYWTLRMLKKNGQIAPEEREQMENIVENLSASEPLEKDKEFEAFQQDNQNHHFSHIDK